MRIIALANQKGGVGKTTTAVHLAHGMQIQGASVVLVDLDPQQNATVAVQEMAQTDGEVTKLGDRFWLVTPSTTEPPEAGHILETVRACNGAADVVVIDCPPRLDAWGWCGLNMASEVVVPVQAEFLSMHGLSQILATLQNHPRLRIRGVLPTMVDLREPVAHEVLKDMRKNIGSIMLRSSILRDSALVEAASHGRTVFSHSPDSRAAFCYAGLIKELSNG